MRAAQKPGTCGEQGRASKREIAVWWEARGRRAHETSIAATMIMRYIIVRGSGEGYAEGCRWRRGGAVAELKMSERSLVTTP